MVIMGEVKADANACKRLMSRSKVETVKSVHVILLTLGILAIASLTGCVSGSLKRTADGTLDFNGVMVFKTKPLELKNP
jgi:hypothetical protein